MSEFGLKSTEFRWWCDFQGDLYKRLLEIRWLDIQCLIEVQYREVSELKLEGGARCLGAGGIHGGRWDPPPGAWALWVLLSCYRALSHVQSPPKKDPRAPHDLPPAPPYTSHSSHLSPTEKVPVPFPATWKSFPWDRTFLPECTNGVCFCSPLRSSCQTRAWR